MRYKFVAWRSSTYTLVFWFILAVATLLASDTYIQQQENLSETIKTVASPIFLPLGDMLHELLNLKQQWNDLQAKLKLSQQIFIAKNIGKTPPPAPANASSSFISRSTLPAASTTAKPSTGGAKTSPLADYFEVAYANSDFIAQQMGASDVRRKELLLSMVEIAPYHFQSLRAYYDLFNDDWKTELSKNYSTYARNVTLISVGQPSDEKLNTLLSLWDVLKKSHQASLELATLEEIYNVFHVRFGTFNAMEQLARLLPAGSEKKATLEKEIADYNVQREVLLDRAKWYYEYESTRKKKTPAQIDQILESSGQTLADPFTASAAATFIEQCVKLGDVGRVMRWRKRLATFDLANAEEAGLVFDWVIMQQSDPSKRPNLSPPDLSAITSQKWRGLLDMGRYEEAQEIQANAFGTQFGREWWPGFVAAHEALMKHNWDAIKPIAELVNVPAHPLVTATAPATMPAAATGFFDEVTIDLSPASSGVKADIHSQITLTLTPKEAIIVVVADEPRPANTLPKLSAKKRDDEVIKDECFEFFFCPDQTPEFYYYLAFNRDRVFVDSTATVFFTDGKVQVRQDKGTDLGAKIIALPAPSGKMSWQITLPRLKIFPVEQQAIRFNVRRFRYVTEGKSLIPQIYTWASIKDQQPHPEAFGWIINPSLFKQSSNP